MTTPTLTKTLSAAEQKRLEKFKNRRGRKKPAKIPARLARTSAFAPRRQGLITDSNFERLYVVPGHSVIKVSGRELGTQHRDAIYALFRLPNRQEVERKRNPLESALPFSITYETRTTWRELLQALGRSEHTNNVVTLMQVFEDIKKVVVSVYEGRQEEIVKAYAAGELVDSRGMMGNLLNDVEWSGVQLDSEVAITYGNWSAAMMSQAKLVSLNADVQFRLHSDYAKTFWPYIDSMNNHIYVDEEILSALAGRDLWGEHETKLTRAQFRRESKRAFEDMVSAGGLVSFEVEVTGKGRRKSRRYRYQHALARQMELALEEGRAPA